MGVVRAEALGSKTRSSTVGYRRPLSQYTSQQSKRYSCHHSSAELLSRTKWRMTILRHDAGGVFYPYLLLPLLLLLHLVKQTFVLPSVLRRTILVRQKLVGQHQQGVHHLHAHAAQFRRFGVEEAL